MFLLVNTFNHFESYVFDRWMEADYGAELNELQKRKRKEKCNCAREERLTELEEPEIAKLWKGITKEK